MTASPDPDPHLEVRIIALPVQLWARTQEHTEELLREFALLAEQIRHDGHAVAPLPVRLVQLVDELTADYSGFTGEQEEQLFAAAASGESTLDLTYYVPPSAAAAASHLGDLLNEADAYCRAGRHLLTLATPPELARFRTWFLGQFVAQATGMPPTPWQD